MIYRRYEKCLDNCELRLAEEELHGEAKEGKIALLRREMEETKGQLQNQTDDDEDVNRLRQQVEDFKQQLNEGKAERDAFGR